VQREISFTAKVKMEGGLIALITAMGDTYRQRSRRLTLLARAP
jgi:hypothetical protein